MHAYSGRYARVDDVKLRPWSCRPDFIKFREQSQLGEQPCTSLNEMSSVDNLSMRLRLVLSEEMLPALPVGSLRGTGDHWPRSNELIFGSLDEHSFRVCHPCQPGSRRSCVPVGTRLPVQSIVAGSSGTRPSAFFRRLPLRKHGP